MTWKDKMDTVVKDVLGIEYSCVVNSDKSFSIFENNEKMASRSSIFYLESHWRHELTETLKIIFDQRIQKAMQKV